MVTDPAALPSEDLLSATRARREELHGAICAVETVLASAAHDPAWKPRLQRRLDRLAASFRVHVEATEGEDGLYSEVLRTSPRLAFAIEQLTAEHDQIEVLLQTVRRLAADGDTLPQGPDLDAWIDRVRSEGTQLIGLLTKHRQKGADLLYEAFAQDIGGNE